MRPRNRTAPAGTPSVAVTESRAIAIGEHAFAILGRAGLSADDAIAAFSGILALNYGSSSFTAARELDTTGMTAEQMGS